MREFGRELGDCDEEISHIHHFILIISDFFAVKEDFKLSFVTNYVRRKANSRFGSFLEFFYIQKPFIVNFLRFPTKYLFRHLFFFRLRPIIMNFLMHVLNLRTKEREKEEEMLLFSIEQIYSYNLFLVILGL